MNVTGVYLIFKHESGHWVDKLVRWVTGGIQVHVEFAFILSDSTQSQIVTVGSLWPYGVYSSNLFKDPFYNLYEANGSFKNIDIHKGLQWSWVDLNTIFNSTVQRNEALIWAMNQVGKRKYRTSVFATFLLPYTHSSTVKDPGSSHTLIPKNTYICSEFCADIILAFGSCSDKLRSEIIASCERLGGLWHGDTQKLSPSDLFKAIVHTGSGKLIDPLTVRVMTRHGSSKSNT